MGRGMLAAAQASPAHAGIDRVGDDALAVVAGFPRTRGDRPLPNGMRWITVALPPHTRG